MKYLGLFTLGALVVFMFSALLDAKTPGSAEQTHKTSSRLEASGTY